MAKVVLLQRIGCIFQLYLRDIIVERLHFYRVLQFQLSTVLGPKLEPD